jgi:hypothetical protein
MLNLLITVFQSLAVKFYRFAIHELQLEETSADGQNADAITNYTVT